MIRKGQQLTKTEEFQALNKMGRSWASRLLILKALPNAYQVNRHGFSVGKRVGKAVRRNHIRRRLREIVRDAPLKQGWDILIIVRTAASDSSFRDTKATAMELLARAHLLEEDN